MDGQAGGVENGQLGSRAAAARAANEDLAQAGVDVAPPEDPAAHRHVQLPAVERLLPLVDHDERVGEDARVEFLLARGVRPDRVDVRAEREPRAPDDGAARGGERHDDVGLPYAPLDPGAGLEGDAAVGAAPPRAEAPPPPRNPPPAAPRARADARGGRARRGARLRPAADEPDGAAVAPR